MRRRRSLNLPGLPKKLLRVIWARRAIVAIAFGCSLAGGVFVMQTASPLYLGKARVVLDLVKLDEQTNTVLQKDFVGTYVNSQTHVLENDEVVARVVDDIGWANNPEMVAAYNAITPKETRSFRTWAAQFIIARTSANLLPESNVLEIGYRAETPDAARSIADSLRRAYIDASLADHRGEAQRHAVWFSDKANALHGELEQLQRLKEQTEKQTGIVLHDDNTDIESKSLERLSRAKTVVQRGRLPNTSASEELAKLDSRIAAFGGTLGPNNPALQVLKQNRAALVLQAHAQQEADETVNSANARSTEAAALGVTAKRETILSQREGLAGLLQIQDRIVILRDQYDGTLAKAADARQTANLSATELTPTGEAEADRKPVFPNKMLILAGSSGLGFIFGALLALLTELLSRRIRSAQDLEAAASAPLLGVVPGPGLKPHSPWRRILGSRRKPRAANRPRVARGLRSRLPGSAPARPA
jgi:succinoglycan biosynthesis transport protein ExoP